MELYQLRTFIVVAEEGQITKASRRLNVSQPAVSAQIKALEQDIGLPLFARTSAGIVVTPAGEQLLNDARRVLTAFKEFTLRGRKLREELCQELRLGTIMHAHFIRLGPLILRLTELYPLLRIKLHHGFSEGVVDSLKTGELDAAFLLGSDPIEGISYIELAQLQYSVVAPIKWKSDIAKATLSDLSKLPWLGAPAGTSLAMLFTRLFPDPQLRPTKMIEVDQEAAMISLVLEEVGLCLMRLEVAENYRRAKKVVIWPGQGPRATLAFAYETGREKDAAIAATIKIISQVWQEARSKKIVDVLTIGES
jgi:DNA-binding transcriptional LysR family regulator